MGSRFILSIFWIVYDIINVDCTDLLVEFDSQSSKTQVEVMAAPPLNYKSLARYTVCNMTDAFPALTALPKPWSCPKASNITWCEFTGVVCRPTGTGPMFVITELKLSSSSLKGTIPATLSQLPLLLNVVLDSNSIYGTIPSVLGNIVSLTALYLQKNSLIGTVPLALTKLTNLKIFNVNFNYMTGALPSWFTQNTVNNVTATTPSTYVLRTAQPSGQPSEYRLLTTFQFTTWLAAHPHFAHMSHPCRCTSNTHATKHKTTHQEAHFCGKPSPSFLLNFLLHSAPIPLAHQFHNHCCAC